MSTNNPVVDRKCLGHALVQDFFPWIGVSDLEKAIYNLSIIMATTFSTSVQAFEYQRTQIDGLAEVILQIRRALGILMAQRRCTWALLEECYFYVTQSSKITQELKTIKDIINLLAEVEHMPGLGDYFHLFSWLSSGIGSWLRRRHKLVYYFNLYTYG